MIPSRSDIRLPTPYRVCQGCKWFESLGTDGTIFCQYHGRVEAPMQVCIVKEKPNEETN